MDKYYNICIIAEGSEEYAFFDVVRQLGTHEKFCLEIENASGVGSIPDLFLSKLRDDLYDCILCAFDVDNRASDKRSQYSIARQKLNSIFGDEAVTDNVCFCSNPNILQLFLLAADTLDKVALKSTSKESNTEIVHKYWPKIASGKTDKLHRQIKPSYNASAWQLDIIKNSIIYEEYHYSTMLKNAAALSTNYKKDLPASNLLPMLIALKNGDETYFKNIRMKIDSVE